MSSPHCICGIGTADIRPLSGPTFGERALWRCNRCALVQLFPWPGDGVVDAALYQNDNYMAKIGRAEYFGYYKAFEEYLREAHRIGKDLAILDFGAGHCWYQRFMTDEGYANVQSVEINQHLVAHGRNVLGLRNVHTDASELPDASFDLVISNQVFEHLPDPMQMLRATIHRLLKPGGMVCFSVPNWDSWNRPVLRQRWLGYSPEDHLWFFNRQSLTRNLAQVPEFDTVDMSIRSAVGKPYDGFRPQGVVKRLYYQTAWRLFETLGHGDQLIAVLRKRQPA